MRDAELDPLAILASFGWSSPSRVTPITGGWDTAIWRVEYAETAFALRVFRPEQAEVCRREAAAMGAVAAGGIPVPSVEAQGVWRDRPALLLSWCLGRPLLHELGRSPWRAWVLGKQFGRMQAHIHSVSAPEALRRSPTSWIDWMGPNEQLLRARLGHLNLRNDRMLHLDYHPLNVMVDGSHLTGVLDWANARAGDPRADLALTVMILRLFPASPGPSRPLVAVIRRLLETAWRSGYVEVAGPMGDLAPFYAWAGAARLRDLAPKLGRPGVPLRPEDLDRIREWTFHWKRRAGIE